jgi:hypothetical protein
MLELNDAIFEDVMERIANFEKRLEEANGDDIGGIDVYAYSFTDENFIQIYNTVFEYPTYGTAGDLFGYIYDIENDDYVTVEEFIESLGKTGEEITEEITAIYSAANPDDAIGAVYIKTYHLMKGPDGEYTYGIMFEMEVTKPEAGEPNKQFYMYNPANNDVWKMNGTQLFDPNDVDQYDPPLHCQEGWEYSPTDGGDESEFTPAADLFEILQGDYYFDGDTAAAHFTFTGTEIVDAYTGSGSYETSYTLAIYTDTEIEDDSGDMYRKVGYELYDADGNLAYTIIAIDAAPGSFELYDKDGYFVTECVNLNV